MEISLERDHYEVGEGDGEVEMCAVLNTTYDVECAPIKDFSVNLSFSNLTAGRGMTILWGSI